MKLDLKFVTTPLLTSNTNLGLPASKNNESKWLLVTLLYSTPEIYVKSGKKNMNLSYDDFKVSMKIVARNGEKEKWTELFSGNMEYEFINTDGGKHIALGFIPPQYIKRYLNNVGDRKSDVKDNFFALVEIKNARDMIVAAIVWKNGDSKAMFSVPTASKTEFSKYSVKNMTNSSDVMKLRSQIDSFEQNIRRKNDHRDLILDRSQTPWEYLELDRLEVLKRVSNK